MILISSLVTAIQQTEMPLWFSAFAIDPMKALERLLNGTMNPKEVFPANPNYPADILGDWLATYGEDGFGEKVDGVMAQLISHKVERNAPRKKYNEATYAFWKNFFNLLTIGAVQERLPETLKSIRHLYRRYTEYFLTIFRENRTLLSQYISIL